MSVARKHAYRFQYLRSDKWQIVRLEALVRERGKCQICGEESVSNDAHHIWYPENIWDTVSGQLAILCRPCHDFLHAMMPRCKTSDPVKGRAFWNRFAQAIIVWRQQKLALFESSMSFGPAELRASYNALKRRVEEQNRLLVRLAQNGKTNLPLDGFSRS